MEYLSHKIGRIMIENKIFRHSSLLRFDARPAHFQRRIYFSPEIQ